MICAVSRAVTLTANEGFDVAVELPELSGLVVFFDFFMGTRCKPIEFRHRHAILARGVIGGLDLDEPQRHDLAAAENPDIFPGDGFLDPNTKILPGFGDGKSRQSEHEWKRLNQGNRIKMKAKAAAVPSSRVGWIGPMDSRLKLPQKDSMAALSWQFAFAAPAGDEAGCGTSERMPGVFLKQVARLAHPRQLPQEGFLTQPLTATYAEKLSPHEQ